MLGPVEYREALEAARDEWHSKNHPFFKTWAAGELSNAAMRAYCQQHFNFVSNASRYSGIMYGLCDWHDARELLLENLNEEEDPDERWAPGWGLGLDTTPLRVTVVEPMAQPAPCERLELTGRVVAGAGGGGIRAGLTFGATADDFRSGEVTLRSDHPETSLTLLSRYRMPYADLDPESDRARVTYRSYPTTFLFGLGFRETRVGFEQTMSLGWFDQFHLRAEAPGCDPVNLSCDETGRCSPGNPTP